MVQAQESKSKVVNLPKQGDIAFGVNLMPILDFAGNIANGNTDNTISDVGGSPWTDSYYDDTEVGNILSPEVSILAKYMLTDEIAVKVNLGFTSTKDVANNYSYDYMAYLDNPLSEAKVIDTKTTSSSVVALSVGGEYRIGQRRLVGIVGVNFLFAKESKFEEYSMGNELSLVNQAPSANYLNQDFIADESYQVDYFTETYMVEKYGDDFTNHYGLGIDLGVEYMLASQVAIGGSVSIYGLYTVTPSQYLKTVGFNTNTNAVEYHTELTAPESHTWTFGTSNMGAKIYTMFYF